MLSLLFMLLACGGPSAGVTPCVDNGQCSEGQACVQDTCVAVECTSSSSCDLGQYCNETSWTCVGGCGDDSDCAAGETCNTESKECEEYGCRTTQLDCEIGEFCETDESSQDFGECYEDTRDHCQTCDSGDRNACSNNSDCWIFEVGDTCRGDSDCPSGQSCDLMSDFSFRCHVDRCLVECNTNQPDSCPRGFACQDITGLGDERCVADCTYLDEEGYL